MHSYLVLFLFSFGFAKQYSECTLPQNRQLSDSITKLVVSNPYGSVQISHNGNTPNLIQFFTDRPNDYTSQLTMNGDTIQLKVLRIGDSEEESVESHSPSSKNVPRVLLFYIFLFFALLRSSRSQHYVLFAVFFLAIPFIEG